MHVITLASRRDGAGKTTLCTHLAAAAQNAGRRCVLIDADPQGTLTRQRSLRLPDEPPVRTTKAGIERALVAAEAAGYRWAFVDTPARDWGQTSAAIAAATLVVIPVRASHLDLEAVRDAVDGARSLNKPFALVINAAPSKRGEQDSPTVSAARRQLEKLRIPVWPGQITQRVGLAIPLIARRHTEETRRAPDAASEIASLWSAILRAIAALHVTRNPQPQLLPARTPASRQKAA